MHIKHKEEEQERKTLGIKTLAQVLPWSEKQQTATFARLGAPVIQRPQILIRLALAAVSARGRCIRLLRGKTPCPG